MSVRKVKKNAGADHRRSYSSLLAEADMTVRATGGCLKKLTDLDQAA